MAVDLEEENRVLRARIAELERTDGDPLVRALLEHAPSFMLVVSPDGRMLATGRPSSGFGSVVGRSAFEFSDPASHDVMRDALKRATETGRPVSYEAVGFGEDGTPGHVYLTRLIPLGSPVEALVMIPTDITERVRLTRERAESEQALRLAVDATRMGLWRWDLKTGRLEWDQRLLDIWGVDEPPASFDVFREQVLVEDRARLDAALHQSLAAGVHAPLEIRARHVRSGEVRHLLSVGTVFRDEQGKPARLVGGVLDLTEKRALESQLARALRGEALGQLAAGVAHNFNNLLTAIIPNVEMALDASPPDVRPQLRAALDASLQARDVVKGLLELARSRDGERCDAAEVATRLVAIGRATLPREIELVAELPPAPITVAIGASALEQALLNLLFNARDALEGVRAPRIRLAIDGVETDGGPRVRIRVEDNGIGMTPEVRARLFEPFFTTKPPHKGSGLGLANTQVRIRDAGGTITCTSAPNAGARFELLLLPVAPVDKPAEPATVTARSRGETILVVDDEPLVRTVVRRILEVDGYRVLEASSAAGARELLGTDPGKRASLVLIDHSMPGETGIAALPSLRALTPSPIVLLTGMAPEATTGVTAVFEKPIRAADLLRRVREVLDGATPA